MSGYYYIVATSPLKNGEAMPQGMILVLIGPPGAGKDSLTRILAERTDFYKYPSGTTRAMRPGETPFHPYTFYSKEGYEELRKRGGLFNDVVLGTDNYFLQMEVFGRAAAGEHIVLHLVYKTALEIREQFAHTRLVLVLPPDEIAQRLRMTERGDDTNTIEARLANEELQNPPADGEYDLVIVNQTGRLQEAAKELLEFVGSA